MLCDVIIRHVMLFECNILLFRGACLSRSGFVSLSVCLSDCLSHSQRYMLSTEPSHFNLIQFAIRHYK